MFLFTGNASANDGACNGGGPPPASAPAETPVPARSGVPFGVAIEALKNGRAVRRKGWNGKGMSVTLNRGSSEIVSPDGSLYIEGVKDSLFDCGDIGTVTRLPNLTFVTAQGSNLHGWLASQTDILSEDWEII